MPSQTSIYKLKIRYVLEMVAVVTVGWFALLAYVQSHALSQHEISTAQGVFSNATIVVGGRHMIALGRSGWWGLFAATGLGAVVILLLPRKL